MAEMVQETKRKTKYKQYAVLRISARLTFKLRYAKVIEMVVGGYFQMLLTLI